MQQTERDRKRAKLNSVIFPISENEVKDHFKENYRRMRQIQKESNQKENESKQPVKALWKSTKYENIESKVKEELLVRSD